jgi:hypothetical protein
MYFSGVDSSAITIDDPNSGCIRINAELYARVRNNNEQNTRVFLDTHLLRIRSNEQKPSSQRLISKSNASVLLERMPLTSVVVYITNALMKAEFREMSSDLFNERYFVPLDNAIRELSIQRRPLLDEYVYPSGDAMYKVHDIQDYFSEIAIPIRLLYRDIGETDNYFGSPSITRHHWINEE